MTTTTSTPTSEADRIGSHDAGRRRSRTILIVGLVGALVVLFVVALASIFLGTREISAGQIVDTFFNYDDQNTDHLVVWTLRVPRTLAGILVGVALGLAGAVMQGVARNPLADPGLLGVNAGAALAVVCAISIFGIGSAMGYVWFAFVGAAIVSVLVYVIGSMGREGATPVKLALAGAAMTAALQSITTAILLTDVATFDKFRFWTVGALAGRKLELVAQVAPFVAVGVVLALSTGRLLNALSLGDDVARGLGQKVGLARGLSAAAVVLLCGAATAIAGPIGFLGLTIPHVARLITGPDYRWILPYSMVLAPILLLISDIVGRLVARPGELQVGIVMAVLGAPFFIALVRRRKLAEL
ncbi:MAG: iron chelate uptake ABC transporter family permease subunit [Actinomycetia bacterium]|nr:iron chelate uptake ABC transporter family permease subunit [Actinomycetes bacterium]